MVQRDAATRIGTREARTEEPTREECTHLNGASSSARNDEGAQVPRTAHSHRCEQAYHDWTTTPPSRRPLAVARGKIAEALDAFLHERWLAGDASVSNVAIARACGVDERVVRGWREGEKALPAAALLAMPLVVVEAVLERVNERRSLGVQRRAVSLLREALDLVDKPVATEDRAAVMRELLRAQKRLVERMGDLAEGKP